MVKNLPVKQETQVSIPGPGRSPGERNGNPLQYSCLGNPMDRDWRATAHRDEKEPDTTATEQQQQFHDLTLSVVSVFEFPTLSLLTSTESFATATLKNYGCSSLSFAI